LTLARRIAAGQFRARLNATQSEWSMSLEQAIEAEAPGASDLHADQSLSVPIAFVAKKSRCSRVTDVGQELPQLAVFEDRHRSLREGERWAG
jgi:hypothetical protein